jgi:hypothetical protein
LLQITAQLLDAFRSLAGEPRAARVSLALQVVAAPAQDLCERAHLRTCLGRALVDLLAQPRRALLA